MIRRATTEKIPSHMIRQRKELPSKRDKLRQAQAHSMKYRDAPITLAKAPWEEKEKSDA